jgi:hypothetical protein
MISSEAPITQRWLFRAEADGQRGNSQSIRFIISIVGKSGVGKIAFLERLITQE